MASEIDEPEILYGVIAIAKFLGLPSRAAQHQIDQGRIPTFRLGKNICARRQTLREWVMNLEKGQ